MTRLPYSGMLLSVTKHAAAEVFSSAWRCPRIMYYLWNQYGICSPSALLVQELEMQVRAAPWISVLCLAQKQLSALSLVTVPSEPLMQSPLARSSP